MVASTSSATQLTNSADIFGGGTLSSPDSLKTGSNTSGTDKAKSTPSESATMIEGFNKAIGSLPVVSVNSIGAGVQGLNTAPAQPFYGYPQTPYGQAPMANAAPATAPAANTAPAASTNAAPQSGGMTVNIGKKPEATPPADANPKDAAPKKA